MSFFIQYCDQYCIHNCSNNWGYLKTMIENGLLSSANISAALLGMDGAMDDIPLFCPASTQVWRAYHCSKKLMLVSLISDEDFTKFSAALLGCNSAIDDILSSVLLVHKRGRLTTISNIIILELCTVTVTVTCHISPRVIE
jgi:hypothetical protein